MAKISVHRGITGIDYLQIIVSSTLPQNQSTKKYITTQSESIVLEDTGKKTNLFNNYYLIYEDGIAVGELLFNPNNNVIFKPNQCSIRFANHILYHKECWSIIDNILDSLRAKVLSVSRLDIFCDTTGVLDYCQDWFDGDLLLKNNPEVQPYATTKRVINSMYIGSPKADKRTCIYNKTKELNKTHKQYIKNLHKSNEIGNDEVNVERVEVRLKSGELRNTKHFHFNKLRHAGYVTRLFVSKVESHLKFYIPEHNKRTNQCTEIQVLPSKIQQARRLEKVKKVNSSAIFRKKIHIKSAVEEYYVNKLSFHRYQQAVSLAIEYGLEEWLYKNVEHWFEYWDKTQYSIELQEDSKKELEYIQALVNDRIRTCKELLVEPDEPPNQYYKLKSQYVEINLQVQSLNRKVKKLVS